MPTLVTYNLNGLDSEHLDVRSEAAVQRILLGRPMHELILGAEPLPLPDVICLQEVVERSFTAHLRPHLEAAGFAIRTSSRDRGYFEVIAVRGGAGPHEVQPLVGSFYARELLRVSTPWGIVGTAHFDSGAKCAQVRARQGAQVAEALALGGVFAGDTNMRAAEACPVGLVDAWEATGRPERQRFTWRAGMRKARFDRVWMRGLVPLSVETAFGERLEGVNVPISDHLALRATW